MPSKWRIQEASTATVTSTSPSGPPLWIVCKECGKVTSGKFFEVAQILKDLNEDNKVVATPYTWNVCTPCREEHYAPEKCNLCTERTCKRWAVSGPMYHSKTYVCKRVGPVSSNPTTQLIYSISGDHNLAGKPHSSHVFEDNKYPHYPGYEFVKEQFLTGFSEQNWMVTEFEPHQ